MWLTIIPLRPQGGSGGKGLRRERQRLPEEKTVKVPVKKVKAGQGAPGFWARLVPNPTRAFIIVLVILVVFFLAVGNWPLVRVSLLGINVDLPGTLVYVLVFLLGMLAMWFWLKPAKPAPPKPPAEKPK